MPGFGAGSFMKISQPTTLREIFGTELCDLQQLFVDNLDEKQRRLFFGLEALRLGRGGRKLLIDEFSTSFSVIKQGEQELRHPELLPGQERVRHSGGGRKLVEGQTPEVGAELERIMEGHIAGDPMNADVRWTDMSTPQIQKALEEKGFPMSDKTVTRLLKKTTRSTSPSSRRR